MTVSPQLGALLHRSLRVYQVWGANTEVGKTVFSTILCGLTSTYRPDEKTAFLKPVSTGPAHEADGRHIPRFLPGIHSETLYQFDLPVSPHLAAQVSQKNTPSDKEVLSGILDFASCHASPNSGWLFIETAGGVHSPGPSGTTQADLYRPLRLPAILIGDAKLGGIAQTISAFESLKLRGYDVELVLLFQNDTYQNHSYLTPYFRENHSIPVQTAPLPPPFASSNPQSDTRNMQAYYTSTVTLSSLSSIPAHLSSSHKSRISRLESMPSTASQTIWYPFTQHQHLTRDRITVIDSAKDSHFDTLDPGTPSKSLLRPMFDGSASWWTQGLGHGNPTLSLAAAYAAGRYGHVMFAEAVHEPALALAETMLSGMRNERLKRVFYSDNGSTGVEVAVKMALGASRGRYRHGWEGEGMKKKAGVIGLKGSYHGDTMGAMDCSEPGVYNERVEWYEGKGAWLESPGVSDPLFQRTLVKVVRASPELFAGKRGHAHQSKDELDWSGLPVVFDEVFTGIYRLGRFCAASFLGVDPDISVHAKLLTGGLLPLSVTLASESVFRSFLSDDKSEALLHGHSYTAHAVGCQVALESLKEMIKMEENGEWDWALSSQHKSDDQSHRASSQQPDQVVGSRVWSVWSHELVEWLSWQREKGVEGVWALGTVLAIHMGCAGSSAGYKSTAARGLQAALLRGSDSDGSVHSRVLGNVLYLMAGQTTTEETVRRVERLIRQGLGDITR
ncbi:putative Adenosylmethionine-8-amino-7-oxononanoate aminotransferase [Triangularia setosa]|uniref:Adenosylmethionine-8-amino-7-oxononanoate aminotransferase n=1 Tax=Triangularia setosa TaxID=2587417 RepID=A0AAN6W3M5_9PEZI|nr:putative Adenosylmethionine-8-amino-7-oxononanoate aminotransferase [Podospora setosa]